MSNENSNDLTQNDTPDTLNDLEGVYTPDAGQDINDLFDAVAASIQNASDYTDAITLESNAPDEIPADWELVVSTYKPRGQDDIASVIIAAVPTMAAVMAVKADFVADTIRGVFNDKVVDPVRRAISKGEATPALSNSLVQFISRRAGGGFSAKYTPAFNAFFKQFGAIIKSKTPYSLSKSELFEALTNAGYASFHYEALEKQEFFAKLIRAAIGRINDTDAGPVKDKDIPVTADWFEKTLTARLEATYEPEQAIEVDAEFTFDL